MKRRWHLLLEVCRVVDGVADVVGVRANGDTLMSLAGGGLDRLLGGAELGPIGVLRPGDSAAAVVRVSWKHEIIANPKFLVSPSPQYTP